MFLEAGRVGGLQVQLVYYRGFGECKASTWVRDGRELVRLMRGVRCVAGKTQIARVLRHAANEARRAPIAGPGFRRRLRRGECGRAGPARR